MAGAIDLDAFESSTFFDRLQRVQVGGLIRPLQIVNGLGTLLTSVVTLVGIAVALVALQPVLLPFILLGYAPLWYASPATARRCSSSCSA